MESFLGKDAEVFVSSKLQEYVKKFYRLEFFEFRDSLQAGFRGYAHCLGDCGVIPRVTEYHLCALDFSELVRRRALVNVRFLLTDGFKMRDSGSEYVNEILLKEALDS